MIIRNTFKGFPNLKINFIFTIKCINLLNGSKKFVFYDYFSKLQKGISMSPRILYFKCILVFIVQNPHLIIVDFTRFLGPVFVLKFSLF